MCFWFGNLFLKLFHCNSCCINKHYCCRAKCLAHLDLKIINITNKRSQFLSGSCHSRFISTCYSGAVFDNCILADDSFFSFSKRGSRSICSFGNFFITLLKTDIDTNSSQHNEIASLNTIYHSLKSFRRINITNNSSILSNTSKLSGLCKIKLCHSHSSKRLPGFNHRNTGLTQSFIVFIHLCGRMISILTNNLHYNAKRFKTGMSKSSFLNQFCHFENSISSNNANSH